MYTYCRWMLTTGSAWCRLHPCRQAFWNRTKHLRRRRLVRVCCVPPCWCGCRSCVVDLPQRDLMQHRMTLDRRRMTMCWCTCRDCQFETVQTTSSPTASVAPRVTDSLTAAVEAAMSVSVLSRRRLLEMLFAAEARMLQPLQWESASVAHQCNLIF